MNPDIPLAPGRERPFSRRCACKAKDAVSYVELREAFREAIQQRDEAIVERAVMRDALAQATKAIEHFAEWTGTSDYDADILVAREALEGK